MLYAKRRAGMQATLEGAVHDFSILDTGSVCVFCLFFEGREREREREIEKEKERALSGFRQILDKINDRTS